MSLKPICVSCKLFFRPLRNGVMFCEGAPTNGPYAPWEPYKLWYGDKWECRGCGAQIIVGFGRNPISERHQSHFARFQPMAELQINDC